MSTLAAIQQGYQSDRRWSDRYIPHLEQIAASLILAPAPYFEDARNNTDLIVLEGRTYRIACRVRRFDYYQRFPNDITIRTVRPAGTETELTKIIRGFGDYMIYAFAHSVDSKLVAWRVLDLSEFRLWFNRELVKNSGKAPGIEQDNGDGSSSFRAFDVRKFSTGIVTQQYGFQS